MRGKGTHKNQVPQNVRGKGTHKNKAPQRDRQGDSQNKAPQRERQEDSQTLTRTLWRGDMKLGRILSLQTSYYVFLFFINEFSLYSLF